MVASLEHDPLLRTAVQRLVEQFDPTRIILFGSRSRGTSDGRSDYDLLVVVPFHGSRTELWLRMDRSLRGLRMARDLIILTPEEYERDRLIPGTVARPAALEGRVLYDRAA